MCGIAGIWGECNESLVREMMSKLSHRGPDSEGIYVTSGGTMGHRRLSIMDPEGGDQPIYNEDGSTAIVINGEIYNFPTLRTIRLKHHQHRTMSDSEAALHAFEELGPAVVRQLDGMYALAIADHKDLFLARDPIGIKPLYYGIKKVDGNSEILYFASEQKALLNLEVDLHEFPPGTCYQSGKGFIPFYMVPYLEERKISRDIQFKTIHQTMEKSVHKRLMSDVPLGVFLSGGFDSSLIAAIARQYMDELHTFSVGIEGSNDIEAARLVARKIGTIHHEYVFNSIEVLEELPTIIYHLESFDQDLVRNAIPSYFCSKLAADYVKVVLTGEGADELFAGYSYYKEIQGSDNLRKELHQSVTKLHNINLQRLDRMTMAHGLEGRVPFLDLAMIELAGIIPLEMKLYDNGSNHGIGKWVLRKAYEDFLPSETVWRRKEQFDEGSGTVDLLDELFRETLLDFDAQAHILKYPDDRLRSPEEAYYHKLLVDMFGHQRGLMGNVGRWQERKRANS